MREQLQQLVSCGRPWVVARAEMALAINDQYNGGGLSQPEYQELMQDLISTDKLNKEADDVDLKNMLVAAVMAISIVV